MKQDILKNVHASLFYTTIAKHIGIRGSKKGKSIVTVHVNVSLFNRGKKVIWVWNNNYGK